ncbi:hypothetical protein ACIBM4_07575 [Streptomyces sp. NPDC050256]|uniref:hypothetical protein n=1 Tax=Streptomyces sp. NPDC050256 TaxID=3365607 RepID=UPI0037A13AFC
MTTHPRIGSIWAVRFPDDPRDDYDLRVIGVFTKDNVTYVETEQVSNGGLSRRLLEHLVGLAEPVSDEVLHHIDITVSHRSTTH